MSEWAAWERERRLETTAGALRRNGFEAEVVPDRAAAAERVLRAAAGAGTVGFGGSVTLTELGLPERIRETGAECLVHGAPGLSPEERLQVMRRQLTCDLFLTSANAVTLDGKIVNIDATGNRIGALTFGPRQVLVVAGVNKLAEDVDEGIRRIKAWAAPPNARRLGAATPCAETGFCSDCRSPDRICRVVHVMERRPRATACTVVLVGEALGL